MVQGYYTLEEAAQVLAISTDELKQMARKGDIRSFQDRGTWRFRIQDIQEMARRSGKGSEPDLPLGDALAPKPTDSPAPRSPRPKKKDEDEVFDFSLEAEDMGVNLAADADIQLDAKGSKSGKKSSSKKNVPLAGSDSDVRLVADGSDLSFKIPVDSDVKVGEQAGGPKSGPKSGPRTPKASAAPKSPSPRPSKLQTPDQTMAEAPDSGVRLVPLDSDSDVRIVTPGSDEFDYSAEAGPPKSGTDSDIRLEGRLRPPPAGEAEGLLTEEINLDEELKKDEARRNSELQQAKLRPKDPDFPKKSPFELSGADMDLPDVEEPGAAQVKEDRSSDFDLTPSAESSSPLDPGSSFDLEPVAESSPLETSSSFDLEPAPGEASSPLEISSSFDLEPAAPEGSSPLEPSGDDFRLEVPDEEDASAVDESDSVDLQGPSSGINLGKPADSGISLEQREEGSEDIEFSLSLDAESTPKPQTPKPAAGAAKDDSDSEFELSLDLESASEKKDDSDSEFELTLDDSGALESPVEEAPAAKKGPDRDIFETDFEVPGLGDSSSDSSVVEDTGPGLVSSDFEITGAAEELALGEDDATAEEEESGSMVVPLDEEEAVDDAAETVTAKSRQKKKPAKPIKKTKAVSAPAELEEDAEIEAQIETEVEADAPGFEGLDIDAAAPLSEDEAEAESDEEEAIAADDTGRGRVIRETVLVQEAPWGIFPTLVLFPCIVVMVLLGIMGFEMVQQQQQGYKPGLLTRAIGGLIDKK